VKIWNREINSVCNRSSFDLSHTMGKGTTEHQKPDRKSMLLSAEIRRSFLQLLWLLPESRLRSLPSTSFPLPHSWSSDHLMLRRVKRILNKCGSSLMSYAIMSHDRTQTLYYWSHKNCFTHTTSSSGVVQGLRTDLNFSMCSKLAVRKITMLGKSKRLFWYHK
jgi:hypothetical protein